MIKRWKKIKLEEALRFYNGKKRPKNKGSIPVYGGNGVLDYCDDFNTEGENIIIGRVGAYCGNVNFVYGKCWISDNAILGKVNLEFDSIYLYYSLKNEDLNQHHIGSSQPLLTQGILKGIEINKPELTEQKAIAHILSTLDEKIETNNQINKKLEEMAQTIFKHWFVDFEFLDEDGKPYKSSGGEMIESELGMIPRGWEIKEVCDIADNISGYSYKGTDLGESNDAMITIKNFNTTGEFKLDGFKEVRITDRVKERHYAKEFDIIVAHTDLTQKAEIIGNPILILNKSKYKNLIFSMDTVKLVPKDESMRYVLYSFLKDRRFKNYSLSHTTGTTVLHLSKKSIPKYKVVIPQTNKLINKYDSVIKRIYRKVKINYNENESLIVLRNTLLPKLMSGEIRVPLDN